MTPDTRRLRRWTWLLIASAVALLVAAAALSAAWSNGHAAGSGPGLRVCASYYPYCPRDAFLSIDRLDGLDRDVAAWQVRQLARDAVSASPALCAEGLRSAETLGIAAAEAGACLPDDIVFAADNPSRVGTVLGLLTQGAAGSAVRGPTWLAASLLPIPRACLARDAALLRHASDEQPVLVGGDDTPGYPRALRETVVSVRRLPPPPAGAPSPGSRIVREENAADAYESDLRLAAPVSDGRALALTLCQGPPSSLLRLRAGRGDPMPRQGSALAPGSPGVALGG